MKWDCDVIQDILPLYMEDMVSNKTKVMVEEHLKECDKCNENYLRMQQKEIWVKPPKTDGLRMFRNRILFETILAFIVELLALMFIFKYIFLTNGVIYVVFAVFVFLPLASFLYCFHMAEKSLKKSILWVLFFAIISTGILVGLCYYQTRQLSSWYYILGSSFGLIPALIGTMAGKWLMWKRKSYAINAD